MGIWGSILGWRGLFRWDAIGAIVPGVFIAVGIGMLTLDWWPGNLLISQICFAIAALLVVIKIIGHAYQYAGTKSSRVWLVLVSSIFFLALASWTIFTIQGHKSILASASITTPNHKDQEPHLFAELVVDSDTKAVTRLRLLLENGPVPIKAIRRIVETSDGFAEFDGDVIYATELTQGAKMEISGPLLFKRKPETTIFVAVTYETVGSKASVKHYSHFTFGIPPKSNQFQPILPSAIEEGLGDGGYEQLIHQTPTVFSSPTGSVALAIPEKNADGSLNWFVCRFNDRTLLINPITRKVAFLIGFQTNQKAIELPFKEGVSGSHVIVAEWSDPKKFIGLSVDGAPVVRR